jgi:hypothetical protein
MEKAKTSWVGTKKGMEKGKGPENSNPSTKQLNSMHARNKDQRERDRSRKERSNQLRCFFSCFPSQQFAEFCVSLIPAEP